MILLLDGVHVQSVLNRLFFTFFPILKRHVFMNKIRFRSRRFPKSIIFSRARPKWRLSLFLIVLEYDYVILGSLAPWSLGSTGCKIFYVPSLKSSVKSVCIFLTNLSRYLSYSNLVFRFDERKLNAFFIFVIFFSRPKPVVFQQQPTSSSLGMGKASTIDKKPSFDTD